MTDDIQIADEGRMLDAGRRLAPLLWPWGEGALRHHAGSSGALVFLHGELGAGKTTLVRGLLRAWGLSSSVRSPTYTLIEPYELSWRGELKRVFHLDLYRLGAPEELDYLGWQELLSDGGLLLIEWPERGLPVLPAPDLEIVLRLQPLGRSIRLSGHGPWQSVAATAQDALRAPETLREDATADRAGLARL